MGAITPGGGVSRNQMPDRGEPVIMKAIIGRSKGAGRNSRDSIGVSRSIALGAVAVGGAIAFVYFREQTGNAALAFSGASFLSAFMLLPLRCQLDPCHR